MGRTRTFTFRLECDGCTPMGWKPEYGKPTTANLEKWVFAYAKSLELGGVNEHISKALGHIPYPTKAKIVRQLPQNRAGEVLAEWTAGMFQVYS